MRKADLALAAVIFIAALAFSAGFVSAQTTDTGTTDTTSTQTTTDTTQTTTTGTTQTTTTTDTTQTTTQTTEPPTLTCVPPPSCPSDTTLVTKSSGDVYSCPTYECKSETTACPLPPATPQCQADAYPQPNYDSSGCITGYQCTAFPAGAGGTGGTGGAAGPICDPVPTLAADAAGNCRTFPDTCLPPGWSRVDTCPQPAQAGVCGNLKCEPGETAESCQQDCIPQQTCPATIACPDGSSASCRQTDFGCSCDQCALPQLPPGCRQEKDPAGFLRVVCEQKCPAVPKEAFDRCAESGGTPATRRDPAGCEFLDCRFGKEVRNPLVGALSCPQPAEVDEGMRKCEQSGLRGVVAFEGGCKIARCVSEEQKCPFVPEDERRKVEESCRASGQSVFRDFDQNGCVILRCATADTCKKEPPQELFSQCGQRGGQVVIRRDENACIVFADCVQRGDARNAFVEETENVPDPSQLLNLVFKLEQLRIEFDRLSRDANNIADYYGSTGAKDEERYRRASSMFQAARDKVDEIRTKLRDRLGELDPEDLTEIRHDIRYIKDVMLKDIIYVMLGEDDELEEIESGESKECGRDGACFDNAFRLCKPVKFKPEGSKGPTLEIVGIEGNSCVLQASLPEGEGPPAGVVPGANPPYEMTCKIPNYSLGIKGPQDMIEFCEGSMAVLMKQFGGPASTVGGQEFPPPEGGPGGCKTIEACTDYCVDNYDSCVQWTKDHPAYGSPPSIEELRRFRESGFNEQQFGPERQPQQPQGYPQQSQPYQQYQPQPGPSYPGNYPSSYPENYQPQYQPPQPYQQYQPPPPNYQQPQAAPIQPTQPIQPEEYSLYEPRPVPTSYESGYSSGEQCSGCLSNSVCDPGECSFCEDCR